tara:strand:- start:543 stop:710 length:168 start_codon:yes stop_codon:yes gene_type:complete
MNQFDLRKSPLDGKLRKWELMKASHVRGLDVTPEDCYDVWIVTGVYKNRKEVFGR